jgi:hypothetical protein
MAFDAKAAAVIRVFPGGPNDGVTQRRPFGGMFVYVIVPSAPTR